jgi:2-iminobutanoate/2-iminopropanoate deaminase
MRKPIVSSKGAPPKGIYTPAILAEGRFLFVSGQGPVDPKTGDFVLGPFREQAELTFRNIASLLEAGGSTFEQVVKVNVYLNDMAHFAQMNEVYKTFFKEPYPARTTVGAGLGRMLIEVDCVALVPKA